MAISVAKTTASQAASQQQSAKKNNKRVRIIIWQECNFLKWTLMQLFTPSPKDDASRRLEVVVGLDTAAAAPCLLPRKIVSHFGKLQLNLCLLLYSMEQEPVKQTTTMALVVCYFRLKMCSTKIFVWRCYIFLHYCHCCYCCSSSPPFCLIFHNCSLQFQIFSTFFHLFCCCCWGTIWKRSNIPCSFKLDYASYDNIYWSYFPLAFHGRIKFY